MVTLGVTLEFKFSLDPHGVARAERHYGYQFWQRYLAVFDRVYVFGRHRPGAAGCGAPVEGEGVEFVRLTDGRKPFSRLEADALGTLDDCDLLIGRLPGLTSQRLLQAARRRRLPYAVEIVGDPREAMAAAFPVVGPLPGILMSAWMKRLIEQSVGSAYVTTEALQARYPPPDGAPTASYSSVELTPAWYERPQPVGPSEGRPVGDEYRICSVASLERPYKGVGDLIRAIAALPDSRRRSVSLTVVGGGRLLPRYRQLAGSANIAATFVGHVDRDAVRSHLQACDLFVLASRTEGLPRALLEAMALGKPCVATRVGGVEDLLLSTYTAEAGDVAQIARRIESMMANSELSDSASAENRQRALRFRAELVQQSRRDFYRSLRDYIENDG